MRLLAALLFSLALAGHAAAAELKLATWNIAWLTTKPEGHPALPRFVRGRTEADFARLRRYADALAADVVAVQEVDGPLALARVFDAETYAFHLTNEADVQRPGFVVRKGIRFRANADLVALDLAPEARNSLRRGADITVEHEGRPLRLLSIHLKAGCARDRLVEPQRFDCMQLARQVPVLAGWIRAREVEGVAYAILGDFNRELDRRDDLWRALSDAGSLMHANGGRSSPCWGGGREFIDHILLGGPARAMLAERSLGVLVYRETDRDARERLSDHCPIRLTLRPAG
ncbi:endonuclease/exonuclease/phosphatase family protein [Elioraea rosea]|uniref:endonuclease/exonuclease/phosphatase family protein n=1 Tax=Elioraea rosea TaxID=2492390 RepID=UPI0011841E5D|nr:endonuclease/exonuclease/phosphatase family protein [Elioraea rosea]